MISIEHGHTNFLSFVPLMIEPPRNIEHRALQHSLRSIDVDNAYILRYLFLPYTYCEDRYLPVTKIPRLDQGINFAVISAIGQQYQPTERQTTELPFDIIKRLTNRGCSAGLGQAIFASNALSLFIKAKAAYLKVFSQVIDDASIEEVLAYRILPRSLSGHIGDRHALRVINNYPQVSFLRGNLQSGNYWPQQTKKQQHHHTGAQPD